MLTERWPALQYDPDAVRLGGPAQHVGRVVIVAAVIEALPPGTMGSPIYSPDYEAIAKAVIDALRGLG